MHSSHNDNFKFDKHRKFRKIIYKDLKNNDVEKYDYGNGYFYQSLDKINLSGLRSSKNRLKEYGQQLSLRLKTHKGLSFCNSRMTRNNWVPKMESLHRELTQQHLSKKSTL